MQTGLIAYQRGHITVLDRAGLNYRSCACHDVVSKEYMRRPPVHWGQQGWRERSVDLRCGL